MNFGWIEFVLVMYNGVIVLEKECWLDVRIGRIQSWPRTRVGKLEFKKLVYWNIGNLKVGDLKVKVCKSYNFWKKNVGWMLELEESKVGQELGLESWNLKN